MAGEQEATLEQLQIKSAIISRNIERRELLDEDLGRRIKPDLDIDELLKLGSYRERLAARITEAGGKLEEVQRAIAEHSLLDRAQKYLDEVASYRSKLAELERLADGGYIVPDIAKKALRVHQSRFRELAALPGTDPELRRAIGILRSRETQPVSAPATAPALVEVVAPISPEQVPTLPKLLIDQDKWKAEVEFVGGREEEPALLEEAQKPAIISDGERPKLTIISYRNIKINDRKVSLSERQARVFGVLVRHPGRQILTSKLSGEAFGHPDSVKTGLRGVIFALEQKLSLAGLPGALESKMASVKSWYQLSDQVEIIWAEPPLEEVPKQGVVAPVEKPKKVEEDIYKISFPSGKEIGIPLKGHTQIQLLEKLLETSADRPVSRTELLLFLYQKELDSGILEESLIDRLSVALSLLRKRLEREKVGYRIENLLPKGVAKEGRYYLKEVEPKIEEIPDALAEEKLAPEIAEPPDIQSTPTPEAALEIREIFYTPSEQEVRTEEETRILSVLVDNLSAHTRLYFDKIQRELKSPDRLEQTAHGGVKFYIYGAKELIKKFTSACQKMFREQDIPALRARWSEEEEELWKKMQAVYGRLEARDLDNFFAKIRARIDNAQREFYRTYKSGNGGRPYIVL